MNFVIDVRPLRHPAYRRLFVGNSVSYFGLQFTTVAVAVQMFRLTNSSGWVGLLGLVSLVPLLFFALWGGAVADSVDRRKLLLASSTLMWLGTLGLLLQAVLGVDSPLLLLALVVVQTVGFAVSAPTRGAIVPRLVAPAELPAANTLNFTASQVGFVLGPLGAGLVLAHSDVYAAYLVDAVLFTVTLWAAMRLPAMPPETAEGRAEAAEGRAETGDGAATTITAVKARTGRLADVMFGLRYIAGHPVLLLSFAIDIAAMVLAMPKALFAEAGETRFAGDSMLGLEAVGWLYAAISIGSVLAGLTGGWISRVRRQGLALVVAVVVWGLAVAVAGLADALWLAVLFLAVGGAADLVSAVYRQTILQTYAPDELRGRMQGVFTAVVAGGPRLGDLRAGMMAYWGLTLSWVSGGVAAAVVAVLLAVAFPALLRYVPSPERH